MTSEIAVMNQRAVALAADSAVTLVDGGTVVVRNEQRKLFNLIEGKPVGLMFFGLADLMGHPWEQLIEHYQKTVKSQGLGSVRDYSGTFTGMLDGLETFFPKDRYRDEYRRLLASVFRYVFQLAQFLRDSADPSGPEVSDTAMLEAAIERVWRDYQFRENGSPRANLSCFPKDFGQTVATQYGEAADELIAYGFAPFGLSKQATQKLKEIGVFCVIKDLFLEDVAGLVFAGFGSEERYPNVVTWLVSGIVGGYAKRMEASSDVIDGEVRSKIRVFADSEVTNAFIRGIDLNLERRFYGGFRMMMHGLVDQVVGAVPGIDTGAKDTIRDRFQRDFVPKYLEQFHRMMADYQQQAFINPVLRVLEIATRNELAETAGQLVSLNIFKKRIMAHRETVGGAVDVAIITRENGFQWWSRQGGTQA
jgi:hypothetical protein